MRGISHNFFGCKGQKLFGAREFNEDTNESKKGDLLSRRDWNQELEGTGLFFSTLFLSAHIHHFSLSLQISFSLLLGRTRPFLCWFYVSQDSLGYAEARNKFQTIRYFSSLMSQFSMG